MAPEAPLAPRGPSALSVLRARLRPSEPLGQTTHPIITPLDPPLPLSAAALAAAAGAHVRAFAHPFHRARARVSEVRRRRRGEMSSRSAGARGLDGMGAAESRVRSWIDHGHGWVRRLG